MSEYLFIGFTKKRIMKIKKIMTLNTRSPDVVPIEIIEQNQMEKFM